MGKFPTWDRPDLRLGQLEGEERRLAPRGLFPEQVRADVIRAAACHDGHTRGACLAALAESIESDATTISQFLRGKIPVYGPILEGLYGPVPANTLPAEWANPADWGDMLTDAVAAGLVDAAGAPSPNGEKPETNSNPDAGGVPPTVDLPASGAVGEAASDGAAPAASPVVAEASPTPLEVDPAPELGQGSESGHQAPPAPVSTIETISPRAPMAGQDGEGSRCGGGAVLAGISGSDPVQLRDAAGEGAGHGATSPPPTNSFTRVLGELDGMVAAARQELADAEADAAEAVKRVQLARLTVDALAKAFRGVNEAHAHAQELIANAPVELAARRAA